MTREQDTRQLFQDAAAHMPRTQPPLEELIREGRRTKRLRGTALVMTAAASVAVVAVGGFLIAPTLSSTDSLAKDSAITTPEALSVPPGRRLVGMNGIAVEVPANWGVNEIRCGQPTRDTVVFERGQPARSCFLASKVSSLHLATVGLRFTREFLGMARHGGAIEDVGTSRSAIARLGCGGVLENQCPAFVGSLVVPTRDVVMWVNSQHRLVVEDILGSARLIPQGYAAVPDLSGMDETAATKAAEEAGLSYDSQCPDGTTRCDVDPPIQSTDPAAGSVVSVDTTVRATEPPSSTPAESVDGTRLVGMGRVVVTVPGGWASEIGGCVDLPQRNTVYFPAELMLTCAGKRPQDTSSVRFYDSTSQSVADLVSQAKPAGRIDGVAVSRIPTERGAGITEGVLIVPNEDLLIWVDSPTPSTVSDILESVSLLPKGLVAIPTSEGQWQSTREEIMEAGLAVEVVEVPTDEGPGGRLIETRPDVGSVVSVGSTVSLMVATASDENRSVVNLFHRFANNPTGGGPFDTPISLGLGGRLVKTITTEESYDEDAWVIDVTDYAERDGTVSALELLRQSDGNFRVVTGEHRGCPGPGAKAPLDLSGGGRLLSIQPRQFDSCIDWWSVDLYVNDVQQVVGVDVHLGSP